MTTEQVKSKIIELHVYRCQLKITPEEQRDQSDEIINQYANEKAQISYNKGYEQATKEACKEIAKDYQPNHFKR